MRSLAFLAVILAMTFDAIAAEPIVPGKPVPTPESRVGEVAEILKDKKQIVVKLDPGAGVGSTVIFSTQAGEACEGFVLNQQDGKAVADFGNCRVFADIAMGSVISGSYFGSSALGAKPSEPKALAEAPRYLRFRLGFGSHIGREAKFGAVSAEIEGASAQTATVDMKVESANQFMVGFTYIRPNTWGLTGGFTWEEAREITEETLNVPDWRYTYTYLPPRPTIQIALVELNVAYRWDQFYIPVGVNRSFAKYTSSGSGAGTGEVSGGFGAQAGIGIVANDYFWFELLSQYTVLRFKQSYPSWNIDYGIGHISGMALRIGAAF